MEWGLTAAEDSCINCEDGFELDATGVCQDMMRTKDLNCIIADSNGWCTECKSGFLDDGTGGCYDDPYAINNCEVEENEICSQCMTGYNLANNQCIADVTCS